MERDHEAYSRGITSTARKSLFANPSHQAEHLSFPLQAQPEGKTSAIELAAKFQPRTELESSVDRLLKSAKLRDEDIVQTEKNMLKGSDLSVEEVAARRAELRRNRELMFRADVKAKRVAKIKSKAYRKIRRREREKVDEEEDSDDEGSNLKREVERARERATLRHKNTGKWAKQAKGRAEFDEDGGSRAAIEEMLAKGETLRRKIQGKGSDDESDGSDDGLDDEEIRQRAFDELERLNQEDKEAAAETEGTAKGVWQMKFMTDAMSRKQGEADKEADDFVKEMNGIEDVAEEADPSSGVAVTRAGGRAVYRPGTVSFHPSFA